MFLLTSLFIFILGTVVGSFLNVLIDRPPRGKSIRGRSYCDACHTPLPWYDLIPLLSFLWLGGRCRFCQTRIARRIPVVELLTGIGFAFIFWLVIPDTKYQILDTGYLILATYYLLLFSAFVVLFFTDLEYGVLPDKIVLPAAAIALVYRLATMGSGASVASTAIRPLTLLTQLTLLTLSSLLLPLLSALCLSLFFLLLIFVTRGRGMGFGDVKLGFLIGLVLSWPKTLVAAFFGFLFGALVSVILLVVGKKHFGDRIPFGPFLIVGTGVAAIWGNMIWGWYLSLL